jgi:arsenite methyltransferase
MTAAIETRYADLAESSCCLSCGTAASQLEPAPGQVCVDLGCGRGTDALRLADQVGPTGHVFGVDLTDAMLDKARKTARTLGADNVTFFRSDLETIALPDASTDWVTSNCVLNHVADKPRVWREIARILKPGAQFVISDIYALEPIAPEDRANPEAVAECWAGAVTRDEYLAEVVGAGLVDVRVTEESEPYRKGRATVASFTLVGRKPAESSCCG